MIDLNNIITYIMGIMPSILNIITTLAMVISFGKKFNIINTISSKKETELNNRMSILLNENYELKKLVKTLLSKLDGIERL